MRTHGTHFMSAFEYRCCAILDPMGLNVSVITPNIPTGKRWFTIQTEVGLRLSHLTNSNQPFVMVAYVFSGAIPELDRVVYTVVSIFASWTYRIWTIHSGVVVVSPSQPRSFHQSYHWYPYVGHIVFFRLCTVLHSQGSGRFICNWTRPRPMREDVIFVMSSVIGWNFFAMPQTNNDTACVAIGTANVNAHIPFGNVRA